MMCTVYFVCLYVHVVTKIVIFRLLTLLMCFCSGVQVVSPPFGTVSKSKTHKTSTLLDMHI